MTAAARPEGAGTTQGLRDRQVLRVIWIAGAANVSVLLLKVWVGLATGSLAVLSDALHSLSDAANNVLAWFILRVSTRPADRDHPYGHRKYETLAVFGLASLLSVLAFEIGLSALRRAPAPISRDGTAFAVMIAVLAVNVALTLWEGRQARRLESDLLAADAGHTLADVLVTVVVIVGWQLSARGSLWLDKLCALGVAMLVLALAYRLFRRAIPVLVDHVALEPEAIVAAVAKIPGVRAVRDVRSRRIGSSAAVDLVVEVDAHLPTHTAHAITDRVEALLRQRFGVVDATVHVEPAPG